MYEGTHFSGNWHDFLAHIKGEGAVPGFGRGIHENDVFLNYSMSAKGVVRMVRAAIGPHAHTLDVKSLHPTLRSVNTPNGKTLILYRDNNLREFIVSEDITVHHGLASEPYFGKHIGFIRPAETWAYKIADCSTRADRVPRLERTLRAQHNITLRKKPC